MARVLFFLLLVVCRPVAAFCFDAAGAKYHIDPLLIKAIACGESRLNPSSININRDKRTGRELSQDYGLMQVNSTHIPALIHDGVITSKNQLLTRPCLNVQIGTRILASHFQVCGISWNCLGSYNAGFRQDRHETRESYANRIYAIYKRLLKQERGIVL
ncbi:pilus assembly protein [Prodigiosinella confusarubida]|uniref:Pilus assembly protein n=1 Tax=Serratia sp. (strain ATCC 39006) TaxID=104623 RepID=A0A2I5TBF5_SERS3|nr:lytic transglycosylase domain-containing protein [Serratia sp. ATCC 39006]AUH01896.1 pilus assembly protein [Serratia sp. ATCC 39006]AUH06218.1 pilus assembly protein [Serratia sp. ATCC 39006]